MSEWISVKDRLPRTSGIYLVIITDLYIHKGILKKSMPSHRLVWFNSSRKNWDSDLLVTHWTLLPSPPTEEP